MLNSRSVFNKSVEEAKQHSVLYDYLVSQVRVPAPFDDLLRGQIVVTVAAFDKLMHDLIRIGMCQTFSGTRSGTAKYHNESISIQLHSALVSATVPPKELLFEGAIVAKLGHLSFQHPDKIADGLSLIWPETQKWEKIGTAMGQTGHFASTQMKLIATRRNAIVHESDMDPLSNLKTPISRAECETITNFMAACGNAIADLVA
jgi:hypothetical protein